jgi:hypothetical protein
VSFLDQLKSQAKALQSQQNQLQSHAQETRDLQRLKSRLAIGPVKLIVSQPQRFV